MVAGSMTRGYTRPSGFGLWALGFGLWTEDYFGIATASIGIASGTGGSGKIASGFASAGGGTPIGTGSYGT